MFKWLIPLLLIPSLALAQFNGTSGIYALNHMLFGVMASPFTVATPGSGYIASDTVTLDCPNTSVFQGNNSSYPVATYNGTVWALTNPGVGTTIPTTGLAGGNNGTCVLVQIATSGSGTGVTFNATFGFNAASLNGSNSGGGGGGGQSYPILVTDPSIGMVAGGQDNAPFIPALMNKMGPANGFSGGYDVIFPPITGQNYTVYYFTKSLDLTRGMHLYCGGGPAAIGAYNSITLVFAPGIDGVIQDNAAVSGGGSGAGSVEGCSIVSQGRAQAFNSGGGGATGSSNQLVNTTFANGDQSGTIPVSSWSVGDGVIVTPSQAQFSPSTDFPAVPPGSYVGSLAGSTITLGGSFVTSAQLGAAQAKFTETSQNNVTNGDQFTLGNDTWTFVTAIGSTPGNVLIASDSLGSKVGGAAFYATMVNLYNCINGNITTITCVAQSTTPNVTMDKPGYSNVMRFWAAAGGTAGNSLTSTYTAAGTSAGAFSAGTFFQGVATANIQMWQLPISQAYTVNTTVSSASITVTAGPKPLEPGDIIWSKAFPVWTTVATVSGQTFPQTVGMETPYLEGATQVASENETAGTLWLVPAGLKRRITGVSRHLAFQDWPIGRQMTCSDHQSPSFNCTNSNDYDGQFQSNGWGIFNTGNNYSGSGSTNETLAKDYFADLADLGGLGMGYTNLSPNSGESGTATTSIVANCVNQNNSVYWAGYLGAGGIGQCGAAVGLLPTAQGGAINFGPQSGAWTGAAYISQGQNSQSGVFHGAWQVISGWNSQNCIAVGGSPTVWYSFGFSNGSCQTANTWGLGWANTYNAWILGLANTGLSEAYVSTALGYTGYTGVLSADKAYPSGILLDSPEDIGNFVNNSRLFSMSGSAPTGAHGGGDAQINTSAVPGSNFAWISVPGFTTTLGGTVTQGSTTTVTVGACPAVALAAGTAIYDTSTAPAASRLLGKLSSCTSTTLTLQAVATNSGVNGDTIKFMEQEKVGTVQDDIPTISSCGTGSPAMTANSNNLAGQFTMGTGTPTACTITFAHAYPTAAFCTITPASSGGAAITGGDYISAQSAAGFTWTLGTGTSSLVFNYTCGGN